MHKTISRQALNLVGILYKPQNKQIKKENNKLNMEQLIVSYKMKGLR